MYGEIVNLSKIDDQYVSIMASVMMNELKVDKKKLFEPLFSFPTVRKYKVMANVFIEAAKRYAIRIVEHGCLPEAVKPQYRSNRLVYLMRTLTRGSLIKAILSDIREETLNTYELPFFWRNFIHNELLDFLKKNIHVLRVVLLQANKLAGYYIRALMEEIKESQEKNQDKATFT